MFLFFRKKIFSETGAALREAVKATDVPIHRASRGIPFVIGESEKEAAFFPRNSQKKFFSSAREPSPNARAKIRSKKIARFQKRSDSSEGSSNLGLASSRLAQ
jgi:hypothetical protein